MDQMLNSGAGWFPPIFDPKDDRTDEEKKMDAGVNFIIGVLTFVFVILFFACFTSCASHKKVVTVGNEKKDSMEAILQDIVKITKTDKDTIHFAAIDTTKTQTSVREVFSGDEFVTEHIVEFTDMTGNKTVTTDRTIQRKNQGEKQTDTTEKKGVGKEQSAGHDATADSTAAHNETQSIGHWEKNDSTNVEQQKSASNPVSWWDKIRAQVGGIVMALVLLGVIVYLFKYCRGA